MKRFDPALQAARGHLADIGELQSATFRSYMPFTDSSWAAASQRWILDPELSGGGALVHSGSHVLDTLLWLCGPVTAVAGHMRYRRDLPEIEYLAQGLLWTAAGAALSWKLLGWA